MSVAERAMILAAGFGTRMLPITRTVPKALLPIEGSPILEWNLRFLAEAGVPEVAVNAHHMASSITAWASDANARASGLPFVRVVVEETILGTAGGIANAADWLDADPVLVMNADQLFRPDLASAADAHRRGGFLATLLCTSDPTHAQIRIEGGRVRAISPRPIFGEPDLWTFTGVYLLAREAILRLRETAARADGSIGYREIVPDFRAWMEESRLGAVAIEDTPFRETGSPEAWLELLRDLRGPLRDRLLGPPSSGAGAAAGARAAIDDGATISASAVIEESIILRGAVVTDGALVWRSIVGAGACAEGVVECMAGAGNEWRRLALLTFDEEIEAREVLGDHGCLGLHRVSAGSGVTRDLGTSGGLGASSARPRLRVLQGDGSARRIIRVIAERETRILVRSTRLDAAQTRIYPRREGTGAPDETSTFAYVAEYLAGLGIPVPHVEAVDIARGYLIQEDLGETLLYDFVRADRPVEPGPRRDLYREAIALLSRMQACGSFDPLRTHNLPYDEEFILRFEAGYFHREMANELCSIDAEFQDVAPEYERAASMALEGAPIGFMHRDLQSRNLMLTPRGLVVIDFQGARLGPPEYDLASLLLDPYAALPAGLREEMLAEYLEARGISGGAAEATRRRFRASGINRMLQALGAYAWLGGRLGKRGFLEHAPAALAHLRALCEPDFPVIAALAAEVAARLPAAADPPVAG